MDRAYSPKELQAVLRAHRAEGKSIGFIPTMGALHPGHFSLIDQSVQDNDITICSIFVNPTQFNNPDDLANYPNTILADLNSLESLNCDIAFTPAVADMYPEKSSISFSFGELETVMEGVHRPGHFNGVALIVSKLFHMVLPDRAYFGQKDLQQFAIISQLVEDLSFPIELICCPTFRENDGLAMSSRNLLLTKPNRAKASLIYEAISTTQKALLDNTHDVHAAVEKGTSVLNAHPEFELEYLSVVDFKTLMPIQTYQPNQRTAICIASMLGEVRLIDNVVF